MQLPAGVEPLVLADGTVINPVDGSVHVDSDTVLVEVPSNSEIQREIVTQRKRIYELPAPPQQMNTISIIMTYSLLGVSDADIAAQLNLTEEQVGRVKMSDMYADIQHECVKAITESDKDAVRNMLVANSKLAANKIVSLIDHKHADISMAAAKDILDRAGHRPADIIEHRLKVEGGLRVEYVRREENEVPTIDITPNGDF